MRLLGHGGGGVMLGDAGPTSPMGGGYGYHAKYTWKPLHGTPTPTLGDSRGSQASNPVAMPRSFIPARKSENLTGT